jgi:hypothetical protein
MGRRPSESGPRVWSDTLPLQAPASARAIPRIVVSSTSLLLYEPRSARVIAYEQERYLDGATGISWVEVIPRRAASHSRRLTGTSRVTCRARTDRVGQASLLAVLAVLDWLSQQRTLGDGARRARLVTVERQDDVAARKTARDDEPIAGNAPPVRGVNLIEWEENETRGRRGRSPLSIARRKLGGNRTPRRASITRSFEAAASAWTDITSSNGAAQPRQPPGTKVRTFGLGRPDKWLRRYERKALMA